MPRGLDLETRFFCPSSATCARRGVYGSTVTESPSTIRIATISDTHVRASSIERRDPLAWVADIADVLVVAGDITDNGRIPEMEIAARAFSQVGVPTFAVLGNHDRRGAG